MPHVRPESVVEDALRCSDEGMADAENAALHDVAVKTIRRWRRVYQRQGRPRGQAHTTARCPRCDEGELANQAYAELLGWYLDDGHISRGRRDVFNLHIYNDQRYPADNEHIADLMRQVKPHGRPHCRDVAGCVVTTVSWKHWPCLFPQHGPGRKHERTIILEDWQRLVVEAHPAAFLRGLFHSPSLSLSLRRLRSGEEIEERRRRRSAATRARRVSKSTRRSGETRPGVGRLDELIGLKA